MTSTRQGPTLKICWNFPIFYQKNSFLFDLCRGRGRRRRRGGGRGGRRIIGRRIFSSRYFCSLFCLRFASSSRFLSSLLCVFPRPSPHPFHHHRRRRRHHKSWLLRHHHHHRCPRQEKIRHLLVSFTLTTTRLFHSHSCPNVAFKPHTTPT